MDSPTAADQNSIIDKVNTNLQDFWSNLNENQQSLLKKIWSIITYKWQWQLILNAPFLVIWVLDQTIPAVHSFDKQLIASLPIPLIIKTYFGFS
jgi:vacuolar-type H+-ATPase subunit I/STV1